MIYTWSYLLVGHSFCSCKHVQPLCIRVSVSVPPLIESPANGTRMNVNQSNPLTLTCIGSGKPTPHLTWTRDGKKLAELQATDGAVVSTQGSHSLDHTIRSADVNDTGWYTCTGDRTLDGVRPHGQNRSIRKCSR